MLQYTLFHIFYINIIFVNEILETLSGPVSVYGTSFIMLDFWSHDEADSVVGGDQADAI